jgi:hypothetical protein
MSVATELLNKNIITLFSASLLYVLFLYAGGEQYYNLYEYIYTPLLQAGRESEVGLGRTAGGAL